MAKKVRRVRKPAPERATAVSTTAVAESADSSSTVSKSGKPSRSQSTAEEFRSEYAYVLNDLRRVFILAAFLFALLIALNLILQ